MPVPVPPDHPLRRLFNALVQRTFYLSLGVAEPGVVDYLGNLLTEFAHIDNVYRVRNARGKRVEEVAEMLMESDVRLNAQSFNREREVHKHIGDFTLFWSGVYPEALHLFRASNRKDHLIDYVRCGKASYQVASTFDHDPYREEAPVLRRLSEEFELCMFGLSQVRKQLDALGEPRLPRLEPPATGNADR